MMEKPMRRRWSHKVGVPPGTLIYTGDRREDFEIHILDYDEKKFQEYRVRDVAEILSFQHSPTVTWIDVVGLHQVDAIEKIGRFFNLHPLLLEDVLNVNQRPKIDDYENAIFIVLKLCTYHPSSHHMEARQISIVLGKNWVFTFREGKDDVFDPVRERIRNGKGIIRKGGSAYLAYALVDVVVDNYFVVLEKLAEEVEDLEDEVVANPVPNTVRKIHRLRRNLLLLRKSIWPLREVLGFLAREESPLLKKTSLYFRDAYDHAIQVIDTAETQRDMVNGLLDIYLSSVSNRLNEIMKVLTIIATIFIPLSFLAGIYGMNFKYMPELGWKFGYPLILGVMACVAIGMVIYFRRKGWL